MTMRFGDYDPALAGGRISVSTDHVPAIARFVSMQLGLVDDVEHYAENVLDMGWRDHVDLVPLLSRVLTDPVVVVP